MTTIEALNRWCACISVDRQALSQALEEGHALAGLAADLERTRPHLFADLPVFVSRGHLESMRRAIEAIQRVVASPAYQERVLAYAPAIARHDPGTPGVFEGYDFHLGPNGPRLIEINTNAGGAMLNAMLAKAQRACCKELEDLASVPADLASFDQKLRATFAAEHARARPGAKLAQVVIVDDVPEEQYLYPEFRLVASALEAGGIRTRIVDPSRLRFDGRVLRVDDDEQPIDLVYNRLTDFSLAEPRHSVLRDAYLADAAVVSPHPRAHALRADKRNLVLLSDPAALVSFGLGPDDVELLVEVVPRTRLVRPELADAFWAERKQLFFKPAVGYGSKAAYRGDKITKRVFEEILDGTYVAQDLVPPSERLVVIEGQEVTLKVDLRNFVYDGEIQLVAARLYQGQTTNFRTQGGGFATVFSEQD